MQNFSPSPYLFSAQPTQSLSPFFLPFLIFFSHPAQNASAGPAPFPFSFSLPRPNFICRPVLLFPLFPSGPTELPGPTTFRARLPISLAPSALLPPLTGGLHLPGPSSTSRSATAAVAGPRRAPLCPWAFPPPEPGHAPRFPGALPAHAPGRTHFSLAWLHRTRTRVRTGHELPCPRCACRGSAPRPYK